MVSLWDENLEKEGICKLSFREPSTRKNGKGDEFVSNKTRKTAITVNNIKKGDRSNFIHTRLAIKSSGFLGRVYETQFEKALSVGCL